MGTIKPVRESTISSKLVARVIEIGVRAGQTVEAGEVLLRLDEAELRARLRQAEEAERTAAALQEQQGPAAFSREPAAPDNGPAAN